MKHARKNALLAIVLVPTLAFAQRPGGSVMHFFCWGQQFPTPPIVYFTPAFDAPSTIGEVSTAFKQHLRQKYNLNSGAGTSCTTYPTLAEAQAGRRQRQDEVRKAKQTEVDEAWEWSPAIAAAPAPPPKHAPAPAPSPNPATPAPAPAPKPAPPSPPPAPAPPAKLIDPRIAGIIEPYRDRVQKEASGGAQGYCLQNRMGFVGIDCDKFARVLLEYRIAHASEYGPVTPKGDVGFRSLGSLIATRQLPCPDCLDDAKVAREVREMVRGNFVELVMTKMMTQAKADAIAECAVGKYPGFFKASPHPADVPRALDQAKNQCMQ